MRERAADSGGRRPRILIVPGFVADTYSEIERSYVELSAAAGGAVEFLWLAPRLSEGYDNFARPDSRGRLMEPVYVPHLRACGIPYVVARISRYNILANAVIFGRIFREHRIDAVYTHFGYERFWAAAMARLFGKTVIWNEHWHSLGMRYAAAKRLFYRGFVDEFITVSGFLASSLPSRSRTHVIYNGVRAHAVEETAAPGREKRRAALGIPDEALVVLMVAAFTVQKRHRLALGIAERFLRMRPDAFFVFLGDGPTRPAFVERAGALGIGERVRAPGYVAEVEDYYAVSDVSILTSYKEGFGYAVLEAMRRGLPVVVFDSGALPEIVRDGVTGFVVPEDDTERFLEAMRRLADDPELRRGMAEHAHRVVREDFSRDAWVRELNVVLADIVDRRAGSGKGIRPGGARPRGALSGRSGPEKERWSSFWSIW